MRPLTAEYLAEAAAQQQQRRQQQQQLQLGCGGGDDSKRLPASTLATTTSATDQLRPKPVILSPFGLAATLTGRSYRQMDATTQKELDDWAAFYPLSNRDSASLPPLVEVLSGGVRMRYPSKYVLTTDLDADDYRTACCTVPPLPITEMAINALGNPATMHTPQQPANVLPECVWQDCVANPLGLVASTSSSSMVPVAILPPAGDGGGDAAMPLIKEEPGTTPADATAGNGDPWKYLDPRLKAQCSCTK